VATRNGRLTVIGVDRGQAEVWANEGTNTAVPPHRHDRYGGNPDYTETLRILSLLVIPSTPNAMTVKVNAGLYYYQGVPYWFDGSTSGSLSGYVPSGTQKHFVIIAIDRSDNTIAIIDGADVGDVFFSSTTVADIAEIAIADVYLPLAAVQLYTGQTTIGLSDIVFDLRQWHGERKANQFGSMAPAPDTVVLYYGDVDLKTVADYTVSVPSGKRFYPGEIGLICTELDALTTQPTIRAGITGSLAKHYSATITTALTAVNKRERVNAAAPEDGETDFTFGITTGATATTMTGLFYVRGVLL
jgi:hypothetical protein